MTPKRLDELIAIGENCCFGGLTMTDVADLLAALRELQRRVAVEAGKFPGEAAVRKAMGLLP